MENEDLKKFFKDNKNIIDENDENKKVEINDVHSPNNTVDLKTMKPEITDEELDKIIEEKQQHQEEEMKVELAKKAFDEATKNPKGLINATIAQNSLNLINKDDKIKDKMQKASKDTVNSVIDETNASNRKSNNVNYYTGREQSIDSMGGNKDTSKDKQVTMHWIYSIWWYLIMCSLGLIFIAPLKVLLNWAMALSPEIIQSHEEEGKVQVRKIHKMHWLPCLFSLIFYIAYLIGLVFLCIAIFK